MFEYFPGNYVWNLSVLITLQNGGTIGEVDEACRPIREAAAGGVDAGTEQFFAAWSAVADRLVALAQEDEERGWTLSAGEKYRRAALYLLNAERMQSVHKPDRLAHYERAIDLQHRGMRLARDPVEIVEVPYEGATLPAYFMKARNADGTIIDGPAPCIVQWNGFDSFKEHMLGSLFPHELARRGISTLMVDQPGTGGALRLSKLPAIVESEQYGAACVDYLLARGDVDAQRIGVVGWSLAATTPPARPPSRSGSRCASPGGPTTAGARPSAAAYSAKARTRCRTTGTTPCGCGARTPWTTSRSSGTASPLTAWSRRSPCPT